MITPCQLSTLNQSILGVRVGRFGTLLTASILAAAWQWSMVGREREVTSADVASVLAWVDGEARPTESYQVFAAVSHDGEIGIVRLLGDDPTRS